MASIQRIKRKYFLFNIEGSEDIERFKPVLSGLTVDHLNLYGIKYIGGQERKSTQIGEEIVCIVEFEKRTECRPVKRNLEKLGITGTKPEPLDYKNTGELYQLIFVDDCRWRFEVGNYKGIKPNIIKQEDVYNWYLQGNHESSAISKFGITALLLPLKHLHQKASKERLLKFLQENPEEPVQ